MAELDSHDSAMGKSDPAKPAVGASGNTAPKADTAIAPSTRVTAQDNRTAEDKARYKKQLDERVLAAEAECARAKELVLQKQRIVDRQKELLSKNPNDEAEKAALKQPLDELEEAKKVRQDAQKKLDDAKEVRANLEKGEQNVKDDAKRKIEEKIRLAKLKVEFIKKRVGDYSANDSKAELAAAEAELASAESELAASFPAEAGFLDKAKAFLSNIPIFGPIIVGLLAFFMGEAFGMGGIVAGMLAIGAAFTLGPKLTEWINGDKAPETAAVGNSPAQARGPQQQQGQALTAKIAKSALPEILQKAETGDFSTQVFQIAAKAGEPTRLWMLKADTVVPGGSAITREELEKQLAACTTSECTIVPSVMDTITVPKLPQRMNIAPGNLAAADITR